ncbi:MAG: CotH kinase family protein [Myxococcota bacterium]
MLVLLVACAADPIALETGGDSVVADTADPRDGTEVIADAGCDPGAPAVYVQEGETATFTVGCTGDGSATAFSAADLPEGATFDAASGTFTWTPDLDDAGYHRVLVTSVGDAPDAGVVDVWVADAWADPSNTAVDPRRYEEEFGLPVFHLDVPRATNDDEGVPTTMVYRGRPWALEIKYRGAASAYYPKRSYTLSFASDDEFDDEHEGFENRRKVVLTTLFDDNAYLRQLLCYELWSAMDPTRHDLQTFLAVVYVNGAYEGLYLVSDHVSGEYWEDHGYNEHGSLYKAVTHEANFYADYSGTPKSSWGAGYEKQEGVLDDWSDLDAFVAFVAQSDDATFSARVEEFVDIEEIADWWILVRFTEADDSGGKNAYLYVDPEDGRFHHAPWDFNHSFGQTWQTERQPASTDYDFFWSNNLFRRLLADPVHGPVLEARMREQLATTFAADAIHGRIDAWLARAEPSAERDWAKWQEQYRGYGGWYWRSDWTSHDEEVAYLRAWIEEREGYFAAWYP